MLQAGERVENERLYLGTFTQDLPQELDPESRAVDLVTAYAREGADGDITVTDEAARSVLGRLGLGGEKPLRKVAALSGGEKARVALGMFALKASNLLMLDEPSNVSILIKRQAKNGSEYISHLQRFLSLHFVLKRSTWMFTPKYFSMHQPTCNLLGLISS